MTKLTRKLDQDAQSLADSYPNKSKDEWKTFLLENVVPQTTRTDATDEVTPVEDRTNVVYDADVEEDVEGELSELPAKRKSGRPKAVKD